MTRLWTENPQFYLTAPAPCPYLSDRLERKVFTHLVGDRATALNDVLTQGGFRRSQNIAYRPACEGCRACVSVRVVVDEFIWTKAFRRIMNANADVVQREGETAPSSEQYSLFRAYLDARHADGGMADMSVLDYAMMVEDTHVETMLVEYRAVSATPAAEHGSNGAAGAVAAQARSGASRKGQQTAVSRSLERTDAPARGADLGPLPASMPGGGVPAADAQTTAGGRKARAKALRRPGAPDAPARGRRLRQSDLEGWFEGLTDAEPPDDPEVSFETSWHDDTARGELIGCALTDVLGDGLSMVYSFFEPDDTARSLGTYMILDHIMRAKALGLPYVYLGYWVDGSPKMDYKRRFRPQEHLGPQGWRRA